MRYGDAFPVIERGEQGRTYVFDADAVFEFLRVRREEDARSEAEQDRALAGLQLPTAAPAVRSSAKQEIDAWRLRRSQREEAERAGELVPAVAVADALSVLLSTISRETHAFIRQLGREHAWPESYVRAITARYGEIQRRVVAEFDREITSGRPA